MLTSRIVSHCTRRAVAATLSRRGVASLADTTQTALFDWHQEHGGDMVPFAGYALPVLYKPSGVMKEHLWCREKAALFDVSHMGQVRCFLVGCPTMTDAFNLLGVPCVLYFADLRVFSNF